MRRRNFIKAVITGSLGSIISGKADGYDSKKKYEKSCEDTSGPAVEWRRKIPVRYEADVAVIGGGIAGVSAAGAAARSGAKVILVERFAVTGGNLTSGGVGSFCGETRGQGEVFDEIVSSLEKFDAIAEYKPYSRENQSRIFDHEILAVVLQELVLRRSVKMLLHTRFVDVLIKGGRISECLLCGKSGQEALRAKQIIDCTGEGDVARYAGFEVMKGRVKDGLQLPMSMMYFVREVAEDKAGPQLAEGWFEPVRSKEDLPMTSVWPNGPGGKALKVKIPMFDSTDTEGLTAGEVKGRRRMWEVLDYFQRVRKKDWRFDHCSPIIGIREGCRIAGDYVLKVEDLRAGREFEDGVAKGTFYLDGHKPDDEKRTYILKKSEMDVPPYQIPLGSLIAKDGKNLMMAGRCFSADQLSLSSARVSTSCSMMGQAAGITAALCAAKDAEPRDIDASEVKREVVKRGANLEI
ncbi:MAG TPA: FAD-dependent oxidoreductase [Planctomycetes bacterium]|nr:FAD-dependent oxidoreductase [Planctomycetota bacterium]